MNSGQKGELILSFFNGSLYIPLFLGRKVEMTWYFKEHGRSAEKTKRTNMLLDDHCTFLWVFPSYTGSRKVDDGCLCHTSHWQFKCSVIALVIGRRSIWLINVVRKHRRSIIDSCDTLHSSTRDLLTRFRLQFAGCLSIAHSACVNVSGLGRCTRHCLQSTCLFYCFSATA